MEDYRKGDTSAVLHKVFSVSGKQKTAKARMYILLCSLGRCYERPFQCKDDSMAVTNMRIGNLKGLLMREFASVMIKPGLYSLRYSGMIGTSSPP